MFQGSIRYDYAFGVPGEFRKDGPHRAHPGFIVSADATQNVVGRAFTRAANGIVSAGGTGVFHGLLANPKVYSSAGASGSPLAPTLTLPNNTQGEFAIMGYIVAVLTNAAAAVGDVVIFNQATGALTSQPAATAVPAGSTLVPNTVVDEFPQPAAGGLVLLKMTN